MTAILTTASLLLCPHGGMVQLSAGSVHTGVGGAKALLVSDSYAILGCPFNISSAPSPCVRLIWLFSCTRVFSNGMALVNDSASGLCLAASGLPQGPPILLPNQTFTHAI